MYFLRKVGDKFVYSKKLSEFNAIVKTFVLLTPAVRGRYQNSFMGTGVSSEPFSVIDDVLCISPLDRIEAKRTTVASLNTFLHL